MRRFCIHRGGATTKKKNKNKKIKNRGSSPRYTKWSREKRSRRDQRPQEPSQHGKGSARRAGGGVQGTAVTGQGWLGSPRRPVRFLGMSLWINLHLPRAFPEFSSLTRLLGQFCVLPSRCLLRCPLLALPSSRISRLGIRTLNPLGSPFLARGVSRRLPTGTFGIMRHRHRHGTWSMDNGPGSGRSFPARECRYPGMGAERCDGMSG